MFDYIVLPSFSQNSENILFGKHLMTFCSLVDVTLLSRCFTLCLLCARIEVSSSMHVSYVYI